MTKSDKNHKENKEDKPKKNPLHADGTMTTQEIVQKNVERMAPGQDWKQLYSYLYHGIQSNKFRMLRHRDSLLFFKVESPIASNAHIFTTDKQEDVVKALDAFGRCLRIAGFTKLTAFVRVRSLLRLIRKANSQRFEVHDEAVRPYGDTGEVTGYKLTITLKADK
jgi:hypothetical protein